MNLATTLRNMNTGEGNVWDNRQFIVMSYYNIAQKYKIGLNAIMSEYGCEDILEKCSGLIFSGSGEPLNMEHCTGPESNIDAVKKDSPLNTKLMEHCLSHGKPIFGICRGVQTINVLLGGTLTDIGDPEEHHNHEKHNHLIDIKEGSFVHEAFGCTERLINSYHGRCIDKLAPGLEAVAWSKDGIIEAVQSKDKKIFATQWHPELSFEVYDDPDENKLIENFINLCRR